MQHGQFRPKTLEEAKHLSVGACNGFSMEERWHQETPLFAKAILRHLGNGRVVLDYGCGCGRIAKHVLQSPVAIDRLFGVDDSDHQLRLAQDYVADDRFIPCHPSELAGTADMAYCIYVLQHVPAVELREAIARIHAHLRDNAALVYCSSIRRMAIRFDKEGVFDDQFLGVDIIAEITRLFDPVENLFTEEELRSSPLLDRMIAGSAHPHPALVFRKRPTR